VVHNFQLKLDEELQNIPAADTIEGEWSQLKQATYDIRSLLKQLDSEDVFTVTGLTVMTARLLHCWIIYTRSISPGLKTITPHQKSNSTNKLGNEYEFKANCAR